MTIGVPPPPLNIMSDVTQACKNITLSIFVMVAAIMLCHYVHLSLGFH